MGMIITVAQQKGGAGKTMLVANLAAAWARSRQVTTIDIDPQKSLTRWGALRAERPSAPPASTPPAINMSDISGWRLAAEATRLRRTADVILIDSPPQIETDARQAIRAADLILIPLQPSPPDLWAAEGTIALAAAEHRPVCLVLNRAPASSRLRTLIETDIARRSLRLLPTSLGNRTAYPNAFAQGLGVIEAAPKSLAAAEMLALLDDIIRALP